MKYNVLVSIVVCSFILLSSCQQKDEKQWTDLLDPDLSQWEIYQSYRHQNNYSGQLPVDSSGNVIEPVGYNKNEANVFSVLLQNGEPVIHVSGEIYGCLFTKKEFGNYHLSLQVKWGEKKWEPRLDKLKDSGILYHSVGECGVDYWRSWMLSQEFQIMEGHMGDYWGIANSAIDVRAYLPEGDMNTVADERQPFLPIGPATGRSGFCLRSANYESLDNDWTTLELICFEDKSLHLVNGNVVMVLKNSRYVKDGQSFPLTRGRIQLQSEAGEVYFRRVRIKNITAMPAQYQDLYRE